jgi:PAS domain S-box-containing protein
MSNGEKTKEEVVQELGELRRRVAELEALEDKHLRCEVALRKAEEEKSAILENMVEHVVYQDLEMRVLWANRAACESVEMSLEEVVGRRCYEIWAKRSDPCQDCPVQRARETGQRHGLEKATPDGRYWFIQGSPVCDGNGAIVGMVEITLDITARKRSEEALRQAHHELETRVEERTVELIRANLLLQREVEERTQAEQALRESEERLRSIFEAAENVSFIMTDLAGTEARIIEYSPGAERIFGFRREEVIGKPVAVLHMPEDVIRFPEAIAAMRQRKTGFSGESTLVRKSGETFPALFTTYPIFDAEGRMTATLGVSLDISERKRAEEALRESERTLRAILAASPVGICLLRNRILHWANHAMYRIWGYPEGSLAGEDTRILYPDPEEYVRVGHEFYRRIEREGIGRVETQLVTRDGAVIDCYLQGSPLDPSDLSRGVIVAATDITRRKTMEKALQESERRYRLLAENVTDVIWTMDMNLRFTYQSPSVSQLRGYTVEEAMVQTLEDVLVPASLDLARNTLAQELAREEALEEVTSRPRTLELELRCKDGSTVWTEVKTKFLRDPAGKPVGILGVTRDISERKLAEGKLQIYQDQLRSLASELSLTEERERRRLATDLHDSIGQALSITKMKLDTLQDEAATAAFSTDLEKIRELVGGAIEQAHSLLFELSPPILYELGLEAALDYLLETVQQRHGLKTVFEDDHKPKPLGEELRVLLFRAVQELLVNVVKHARAGHARVSVHRRGDAVRIAVEDDGIGFEPSAINGGAATFGLFSIRERLLHLGGCMEIASKPGRGTRVSLAAPLRRQ